MKLRLSSSERLVDLGGVAELKGIKIDGGNVVIGAMTTHASVAASAEVKKAMPALAELAGGIGDQMVRNMGTHRRLDRQRRPGGLLPGGACSAWARRCRPTSARSPATASSPACTRRRCKPGELITAVSFPSVAKAAYIKYKQPASRFALVGVFVARRAAGVRVAVTGAAGSVFRCKPLEDALGKSFTPEAAKAVKVSADGLNGDLHGSAAYRAAMISVMASRAVAAALAR